MVCCRKFKIFLIFLVFLSFFITSSFATSVSDLEGYYEVSKTRFLENYNCFTGTFVPTQYSHCYYIKINKSSDYYVISSPYGTRIWFANEINGVDTSLYSSITVSADTETFINSSYIDNYNYIVLSFAIDNNVSVYNNSSPLNSTVNEVINVLTVDNVLSILQKCVPLIVVVTLVALGYFIIRRLVKKSSKMKGGV